MAVKLRLFAMVLFTASCGLPELTGEALFALDDPPCTNCDEPASLTGIITDACTGAAVVARVTVSGHSACATNSGKGYWELEGLKAGGPQTLAAGLPGYKPFSTSITLKPGFNTFEPIKLERVGGCSAPQPTGQCQ